MDKKFLLLKKKIISLKKTSFEDSQYTTDFLGFLFRVILNLYGITFHPVVVLGPEHDFLFKSASTYCEWLNPREAIQAVIFSKKARMFR